LANPPAHRLADWFTSPAGRRVLAEEVGPLAESVRRAHGDTLLWLGCADVLPEAVRGCLVRSRMYGSAMPHVGMPDVPVMQCRYDALPVSNSSLDALVLHHALETAADPRSVLREAARAIAPGGRLIVCVFNPLSLWGLRRGYARIVPDAFRGLHLLTPFRLLDWLALLGFEVQGPPQYLQYGLPFQRGRGRGENALQRLLKRRRLPLGGVCLLTATKQAMAVRPHWRPAARLAPVVYGKPAFGQSNVVQLRVPPSRLPAGE
jgi:SAM-dependent methyltransferase